MAGLYDVLVAALGTDESIVFEAEEGGSEIEGARAPRWPSVPSALPADCGRPIAMAVPPGVLALAEECFGVGVVRAFPWEDSGTLLLEEDGGFAALSLSGTGLAELVEAHAAAGLPAPEGVAYLALLAVPESGRGRGTGSRLLGRCVAASASRGLGIEAVAWDQSPSPPHGSFARCGFSPLTTVSGLWADYDCPVCREPPCACTGTLLGYDGPR